MKYVVDASVGFKWVVPEIHSDKALRLRDDYRNAVSALVAPDFYPFEIAHTITRAERQGRITVAEGALALRDTLNHLPRLENVRRQADQLGAARREEDANAEDHRRKGLGRLRSGTDLR